MCARKIFPDAITDHVLERDPDPLGRELWQAVRESLHRGAADLPAQHRHQGVVAEPEDGRKLFLSTSPNVMKMPHQFTRYIYNVTYTSARDCSAAWLAWAAAEAGGWAAAGSPASIKYYLSLSNASHFCGDGDLDDPEVCLPAGGGELQRRGPQEACAGLLRLQRGPRNLHGLGRALAAARALLRGLLLLLGEAELLGGGGVGVTLHLG